MDMRELNRGVISEFHRNDGRLSGPMEGAPILLLTTTGRSSGRPHTTPIGFIDDGGRLVVAAANGGADEHPDWFRNIQANSHVTINLTGKPIPSVAAEAQGSERIDLLQHLVDSLPGMADHVSATERDIPVLIISEA